MSITRDLGVINSVQGDLGNTAIILFATICRCPKDVHTRFVQANSPRDSQQIRDRCVCPTRWHATVISGELRDCFKSFLTNSWWMSLKATLCCVIFYTYVFPVDLYLGRLRNCGINSGLTCHFPSCFSLEFSFGGWHIVVGLDASPRCQFSVSCSCLCVIIPRVLYLRHANDNVIASQWSTKILWPRSPWYNRTGWQGVKHQLTVT